MLPLLFSHYLPIIMSIYPCMRQSTLVPHRGLESRRHDNAYQRPPPTLALRLTALGIDNESQQVKCKYITLALPMRGQVVRIIPENQRKEKMPIVHPTLALLMRGQASTNDTKRQQEKDASIPP